MKLFHDMEVKIIVAIGEDGAIGRNGELIWKIPADLKRFKTLTTGHPVIMGRKTWDSLPKKPLPGRRNIVITRSKDFNPDGAFVVNSPQEALRVTEEESPFIIGGAEIYKLMLPYATELFLTEVAEKCEDADSYFHIDLSKGWYKIEESDIEKTPEGLNYRYVTYKRLDN